MFNSVQDYTLALLPSRRKRSQTGWLSFNAVCCIHNGESQDTRGRGAVITSANGGITYKCFNCNFKTSFAPGHPLSFKYRKFLGWMGADPAEIQRLVFEALRMRDLINPEQAEPAPEPVVYQRRSLPDQAKSFHSWAAFYELNQWQDVPRQFHDTVNYVYERNIGALEYDLHWTPNTEHKLSHRVIIPFKYQGEIIGYTARAINDGIFPKYHSDLPADAVFNLDRQTRDRKFVIVCEGPMDAMSVDGVSVQGTNISETQAELIEALGREVIVVPDFDRHVNKQGRSVWPGRHMIKQAIEYGWTVSFPVWHKECKDVNKATVLHGPLFTLKSILAARESNRLKIELKAKKI